MEPIASAFKSVLWKNFAASMDMLHAVIKACPDAVWDTEGRFYYLGYHTTVFLEYYLSWPVEHYAPSLPYQLVAEAEIPQEGVDDVLPTRHCTRPEVLACILSSRQRCREWIGPGSGTDLLQPWIHPDEVPLHGLCPGLVEQYSRLEILFYNFRHVQHHVAQLNTLLRTATGMSVEWVALPD
jgi:hypothetical protein